MRKYKFGEIIKIGHYTAVVVRDLGDKIDVVYNVKANAYIYTIEKERL